MEVVEEPAAALAAERAAASFVLIRDMAFFEYGNILLVGWIKMIVNALFAGTREQSVQEGDSIC